MMCARERISIIIVTKNRQRDCCELLRSIAKQTHLPDEVIVFSVNSKSLEIPFYLKNQIESCFTLIVKHLKEDSGLSVCRNIGIRLSTGRILCFIDDDAIADPFWIKELSATFEEGWDIVGGPCLPKYLVEQPMWWDEDTMGPFLGVANRYMGKIFGCNMAIDKGIVKKIGYFTKELGRRKGKLISYDEAEFIRRAKQKGFRIAFNPKATVYHKVYSERMSLLYLLRRAYYEGLSQRIMERSLLELLRRTLRIGRATFRVLLAGSDRTRVVALMDLFLQLGYVIRK